MLVLVDSWSCEQESLYQCASLLVATLLRLVDGLLFTNVSLGLIRENKIATLRNRGQGFNSLLSSCVQYLSVLQESDPDKALWSMAIPRGCRV